jgi:hypothetical protein
MEFTITCPVDGQVEVGLEDIETVVLRGSERADITFSCPHCSTQVTITAIVPAFLLAAMEALADDPELANANGVVVLTGDGVVAPMPSREPADSRVEAYCEYFRRQLDGIECVEDAVAEMDSLRRP